MKKEQRAALEQLEQDEKFEEAMNSHVANEDAIDFDIVPGQWYDIKRSQLAYEGRFYKENLRFQVQSASVSTIKYFAAMDENNPMSVKDALFKLISTHMRVLDNNRVLNALDVLSEVDQMRALLLINLYTGTGNNLKATIQCEGSDSKPCNHRQDVRMDLSTLTYGMISEKMFKYFDASTGIFNITTKSGLELSYKPVTLRQQEKIIDFTLELNKDGVEVEKQFNQLAGFYMHRFDNVDKAYKQYLADTNDLNMLAIMLNVVTKDLNFQQLPELKVQCEKCGRLDNKQIISIDGTKNIFFVSGLDDEY